MTNNIAEEESSLKHIFDGILSKPSGSIKTEKGYEITKTGFWIDELTYELVCNFDNEILEVFMSTLENREFEVVLADEVIDMGDLINQACIEVDSFYATDRYIRSSFNIDCLDYKGVADFDGVESFSQKFVVALVFKNGFRIGSPLSFGTFCMSAIRGDDRISFFVSMDFVYTPKVNRGRHYASILSVSMGQAFSEAFANYSVKSREQEVDVFLSAQAQTFDNPISDLVFDRFCSPMEIEVDEIFGEIFNVSMEPLLDMSEEEIKRRGGHIEVKNELLKRVKIKSFEFDSDNDA